MALSLSNFLMPLLVLLLTRLLPIASAETVTFDWDIGWTRANPDGLAERPVIGINGQWPLPLLNITKGDRVIVNMNNKLGNQTTSLHFHGMFQNGTSDMDGPVGVTQCDVPAGMSFKLNFTIDQPGTYWYHSHTRGQYPDGFRGQLVVHDPENPYRGQFDAEIPLTLSDWYHEQFPILIEGFINYKNPTGAEPVPNSALMNDTQNLTVPVEAGKTYLFRLTNIGAFAGQYFWIEGHTMRIVEVDGVYTEPAEAEMIYLTAAQRYAFLVTMKDDASANFAMVGSMDTDLFDTLPDTLNTNVTGWLTYDNAAPKPAAALLDAFDPFDDFTLQPQDGMELLGDADVTVTLDLAMDNLGDGASYAFFNGITYTRPVVPTLYSALTTGESAGNVSVYGDYTNSYVVEKDQIVDIVLNNADSGKHPFHLHGHNFQVIYRGPDEEGSYNAANETNFPAVPSRRDVIMVKPLASIVMRFKADNPGVWLFHCHIDWHLVTGLAATIIEAPLELQKTLTIPEDHLEVCREAGVATEGNAAGNTVDVLDLKGQNESVPPLATGFTARGYVALVFSCISAVLGMAVIAWYGAAPLSTAELASAKRFIAKHGGDTK
ncbi:hypothetical protein LTR97_002738 [Elasticomyces elasticus]|uniref:Iron transport multicopper oxidase FET3 n=1 Tax=Elasticomyces elasticus TaxID=574655 RepID=A0AAN7WD52_9PEZI|nr:hypothetical protein LTR97_002738 [Elasticomyces elasticus]